MSGYAEQNTDLQAALEAHKRYLRTQATLPKGRTWDAYKYGQNLPPMKQFLKIALAEGPDYINSMLAPMKMGGVFRLEMDSVCPFETLAISANITHLQADALADKQVTEKEYRDMRPHLVSAARHTLEYVAAMDRRFAG